MNVQRAALILGAGAASGLAVTVANRHVSAQVARQSDPSAAVLPTLMFAGYGAIAGMGGVLGHMFEQPWGAPVAAAGAGGFIGAFIGQNLGLADWKRDPGPAQSFLVA